jgi:calcineurin-like phosphoesterase family protein
MFFFIGCTHAFHNKLLENRGFPDNDSMNDKLAESINSVVSKGDILVHAGDFAFGGIENCIKFRQMIKCKSLWLTPGNHDQRFLRQEKFCKLFSKIKDVILIKGKRQVAVFHYPIESWPAMHYGTLHVHSHCHKPIRPMKNRFNVNVDVGGYIPISFDQLLERADAEVKE